MIMDTVTFTARGHPNIHAAHDRTFEFTKEEHCTPQGDCIVGVSATFTCEQLKPLLRAAQIKITMRCGALEEVVSAVPNPDFAHPSEFVVRIGEFSSDRTFAIRANKAASDFSPAFRTALRDSAAMITVTITANP